MIKWIAVLLLVSGASGAEAPAHAEASNFVSGAKLYEICEKDGLEASSVCSSYIIGAVDQLEMMRGMAGKPTCILDGVNTTTLVDLTKAFMRNHPEDRHFPGSSMPYWALVEAYKICAD